MPILSRRFLWPPAFLPRRTAAIAKSSPGSESVQLAVSSAKVSSPAESLGVAEPATAGAEPLGERRSQALRALFPLLFSMYARHSDLWQAISIERYLSQATNMADLEQRIQDVQRRRQFPS